MPVPRKSTPDEFSIPPETTVYPVKENSYTYDEKQPGPEPDPLFVEPFEQSSPSPTGPETQTFAETIEADEHKLIMNDETIYVIVTALEFIAQHLEHQPYFVQHQRADRYRYLAEQFDEIVSSES